MPLWLHAALCVVVPALWGVVMYHLFNAVAKRRAQRAGEEPGAHPADLPPPIDYSI